MSPQDWAQHARTRADDRFIDGDISANAYYAELMRIDAWLIDAEHERDKGRPAHYPDRVT